MNKYFSFVLLFLSGILSAQQKGATPLNSGSLSNSTYTSYAVVVGISDYQDPAIPDLHYADKDALAFAKFLQSEAGGKLDGDHLKVLINEKATMAQLAVSLDWLMENAKEGDRVYIYFSGHGDVEKRTITQPGFLLCWDAPAHVYMSGGAFALPMLQEVITTLSLQNKAKVIVIADACRSGKLSGYSINGSQLTTANLAKQFSNEIRILSCQPDEYSIEGKQWGGGRGAFSYHLIEAFYGMADSNGDQSISISEIDHYIEDYVTKEVAPQVQVPMIIGNKNEKLFSVYPKLLSEIKKLKNEQLIAFASIDSRGIEDEVLSSVDTSLKSMYILFTNSLLSKHFFEPVSGCSEYYYTKLLEEPKLSRLFSTMKRNYAAALQDDAQQALNKSLNVDIREITMDRSKRIEKYHAYPSYLQRAAELLGKEHYMYSTLQARKLFFEGYLIALSHRKRDTIAGSLALSKFRESIQWEPNLAQTYFQMAFVFAFNFQQVDSTIFYAEHAAELNPSWILPYSNLVYLLTEKLNQFDRAKPYLNKALEMDSTSAFVWNTCGNYFYFLKNYKDADPCFRKSIMLDSTYADPLYNLACSLALQNKLDEAFIMLDHALQIGYDFKWINADIDLSLLRAKRDKWMALMKKYFPEK